MTMTDAQVRAQVERADAFIANLRRSITVRLLHCGEQQRRVLERIRDSIDAVPYVTYCNLSNMDKASRGEVMSLIEVRLMACGGGPTLDFASAADFLAVFAPLIDAGKRRVHTRDTI